MPYPRRATYIPKACTVAFPVLVLAERRMFGRLEYEIQAQGQPESGTDWITTRDGQSLTFEEDTP